MWSVKLPVEQVEKQTKTSFYAFLLKRRQNKKPINIKMSKEKSVFSAQWIRARKTMLESERASDNACLTIISFSRYVMVCSEYSVGLLLTQIQLEWNMVLAVYYMLRASATTDKHFELRMKVFLLFAIQNYCSVVFLSISVLLSLFRLLLCLSRFNLSIFVLIWMPFFFKIPISNWWTLFFLILVSSIADFLYTHSLQKR